MALNYHLMHPGDDSAPGDPNAAFYLNGVYHLHYILRHEWQGTRSYSFVHVTSTDMLHWHWQKTKLQPSFTGHGMFSGTGFLTQSGRPAVIYHGQGSGRNHIAIGLDDELSDWERPFAIEPKMADGTEADMHHWDPDCFRVGDTYYAISGGQNSPIFKSTDLKEWRYLGDFLAHDLPDVALGEDISCPNFFPLSGPLGDQWMLLCISHPFGCRYYLGDWDAEREQFVPRSHGRMNWRRPEQSIYETEYRDFFAPESLLTPDGRRVMWAWLATLDEAINQRTIQCLPRELRLADDGTLRMRPLRELKTLRFEPVTLQNLRVSPPEQAHGGQARRRIVDLDGDSYEIKITVDAREAARKRFGFQLFADEDNEGLPIMVHPETGLLRVGTTEAPFAVTDLAENEAVELRIFVDKYLVEVFVNERQATVNAYMDYQAASGLIAYAFGAPITIKRVDIWRLKATNQGFFDARDSQIWAPDTA